MFDVHNYYCVCIIAPRPVISLKPNYLQQGVIGEAHDLICVLTLSFTMQSGLVNLTWNFTSNDDRVTVIPTTITTDDYIGIIYTTVIQFAYLMEGDKGNYICTVTSDENSIESMFNLKIISKCDLQIKCMYIHNVIYKLRKINHM